MRDSLLFGESLSLRVVAVKPLDDYKLHLVFANSEQRVFDALPLLSVGAYRSRKDKATFNAVTVAYGSVMWDDALDYCPDTLYAESVPL